MKETLAALERAISRKDEIVPKGWFTARKWGEKWSLSRPRTVEKLRDLVEDSEFEVRTFRIWSGQRLYPVPHYRKAK